MEGEDFILCDGGEMIMLSNDNATRTHVGGPAVYVGDECDNIKMEKECEKCKKKK